MAIGTSGNTSSSVMENVGPNIIHHVSNSDISHPILHFPKILGFDLSVTKHVLMLWIVSFVVLISIIIPVRRFLKSKKDVPTGWVNLIEIVTKFFRDNIVKPNVGSKWTMTWTPLILTFFFFILFANTIGMVPIFDLLGLFNTYVLPQKSDVINSMLHGGVTATGNFNVTGALATITFFSIIIAGSIAHGFTQHWKNLVPHGLPWRSI